MSAYDIHSTATLLTRKAVPVEVAIRITMTLVIDPELVALRAVRVCSMGVSNIVKKMNLFFLKHQASCDGVNRSVAPALVEEPSRLVQVSEEVVIWL